MTKTTPKIVTYREEGRLAFLVNIYKSLGYTQETFAARCGISPQLLSWYITVTDDCYLSRLEQMLAGIGLDIKVRLEGGTTKTILKENSGNGVKYHIEGSLQNLRLPGYYPDYISECEPDKRMYFLKIFIESRQMKLVEFAKTCDMDSSRIRHYFIKDDIKVSVLYGIAQAYEADIIWTINPLNDNISIAK